jgi:hypothetical protein
MWCIKCRSQTETTNKKMSTSKNGRSMMTGKCQDCGTKKCKFVSNKKGGLYNANNKREYNHEEEKPQKMKLKF